MFCMRLRISFLIIIITTLALGSGIRPWRTARAEIAGSPELGYSTFVGGRSDDLVHAIGVDGEGNIYMAGSTYSSDFPGISGKQNSGQDIVVLSFDPAGTTLRWSTVIGGSRADEARGLALDGRGNVWITGLTDSTDFPVSDGGATFAGYTDLFAVKLDAANGSLRYANLYGDVSADQGNAVAVSPAGTVYITGQISDASGFRDVLVMALDGHTHAVLNAIRFGRERGEDMGNAIALDADGNIYITGQTDAQGLDSEFPLVHPFQAQCGVGDGYGDCGGDAFITVLDPTLDTILYSTYLGGSYNGSEIGTGADVGTAIALGADGSIYVTGHTFASDFPMANAVQSAKRGADNYPDAFVTRLNPTTNSLIFSTYLGGDDWDEGHALVVDNGGIVTVVGMTDARNFPVLNALQPALGNGVCNLGGSERYCTDGFAAQLSGDGSLLWSTFVGGGYDDGVEALAAAESGSLLIAGGSESPNFPITADAYQANKALQRDGFLSVLSGADGSPAPGRSHRLMLPLIQR